MIKAKINSDTIKWLQSIMAMEKVKEYEKSTIT